jgi:hypothetical protein
MNENGNRKETTITEIRDADLPRHLRYDEIYAAVRRGDDGLVEQFRAYCIANRILYYARPREKFFVREAYELARLAGCDKVLLEDMS